MSYTAWILESAFAEICRSEPALFDVPQRSPRCRCRGTRRSSAQSECAICELHGLSRQDSRIAHKSSFLQVALQYGKELFHEPVIPMNRKTTSIIAGLLCTFLV